MNRKRLLDQNISYKLVHKIREFYPDSSHVRLENLQNENDKVIREFALQNNFNIVIFDIDFYEMSLVYGYPPKVIWLRCGNKSTKIIEKLLTDNFNKIIDFLDTDKYACLELI